MCMHVHMCAVKTQRCECVCMCVFSPITSLHARMWRVHGAPVGTHVHHRGSCAPVCLALCPCCACAGKGGAGKAGAGAPAVSRYEVHQMLTDVEKGRAAVLDLVGGGGTGVWGVWAWCVWGVCLVCGGWVLCSWARLAVPPAVPAHKHNSQHTPTTCTLSPAITTSWA